MMQRFATLAAVCVLAPLSAAPVALADPAPADPVAAPAVPAADAVPPPPPVDTGVVASEVPGIAHTPDGRTLTVAAKNETQLPVAPLTTSLSSREWLVGGTFTGSGMGEVKGGTLEVGYQIGCGIDMSTSQGVTLTDSAGLTPSIGLGGIDVVSPLPEILNPIVLAPFTSGVAIGLKPGIVNIVPVSKKEFTGADPWVSVSGFHVKIDGCVGESFIRSYAVLTHSTDQSDSIQAYYGTTKKV